VPRQLTINGYAIHLTIKEMVLNALRDHFHAGATPSELREYFRMVYSKDIDRNSISPQLARLREEGLVENDNALSGKWKLSVRASILDAIAETERKNVNALASSSLPSRRNKNAKDIFE
jgi:DNA-binding transcriptional ArsR family regulator